MDDHDLRIVQADLAALERRCARLAIVAGIAALIAATTLAHSVLTRVDTTAAVPRIDDEISATRLVIRDQAGRARVVLEVDPATGPCCYIADQAERPRAIISYYEQGDAPFVQVCDAGGVARADIAHHPGHGSLVRVSDADGSERVKMSNQDDGSCSLQLFAAGAKRRAGLSALPDGSTFLTFGVEEATQVGLIAAGNGTSSLLLNDSSSSSSAVIGLKSGENPRLVFTGTNGKVVKKLP